MPRRHGIVAVAVVVVVVLANTSALAQEGAQNGEWRSHGGDTGHIQYAALDQINKDNLGDLEIVWRWASVDRALREQHEELRDRSARIFFHEVTPLKVGGTLYASTSLGQIAAIDPGTGETRWSVDPEVWRAGRPTNLGFLSKGLAYWTDDDRARLFYAGGAEATLVSVDPSTRALDPDFGDGGLSSYRPDSIALPQQDRSQRPADTDPSMGVELTPRSGDARQSTRRAPDPPVPVRSSSRLLVRSAQPKQWASQIMLAHVRSDDLDALAGTL